MVFPRTDENIQSVREACTVHYKKKWSFLAAAVVVVSHRKKLEEVEFVEEELLHKRINKNSVYMRIMLCYRRYSRKDTIHVVKAAWVKHYEIWQYWTEEGD